MRRRPDPRGALRGLVPVVVSAVALTGCSFSGLQDMDLPGGPDVGEEPYTVTAEFSDVLGLAERSAVKVDGVTVGEVVDIERSGWHAAVRLQLPGDVTLSTATRARIQQTSLLGEKFVALRDPARSRERLGHGDRIPLARTSRGSEVEEVLGAASMLLNGGGLDQVQSISRELHTALDSEEVDTRRFLRELRSFITTLDGQRARIVRIMADVSRLAGTINDGEQVVERALSDLAPALRVLESQRVPLVRMLRSLSGFGAVATRVIRESGDDLVADLEALRPILRALRRSGDDLPESVEAILSFPFPDEVLTAARGDYVNLAVEMDLTPLTLLGNATGTNDEPGGGLDPLDPLGLSAIVPRGQERP
jgi:phospholipid/cholesterol/gamma-HCH transport system substrate-binding protein